MDFSLRCNSLKCRTQLDDRAVVTTCSHIFCVACSESLGLAKPSNGARTCPACETTLSNPDDAVETILNPTEDYKTSILSGLSPSIIMECAGRGLSFYSYQTTQEIVYQEFLARSLTDKYSTLSSQMDNIIHDANNEIKNLRDKLSSMHMEQKDLEQKNHDLAEKYREKSKHNTQLQRLYSSLKQSQFAAGMELAAENDADNVLQAAGTGPYNASNPRNGQPLHSRAGSNNSSGNVQRRQNVQPWRNQAQGGRQSLQSSRSAPVPATPLGHRTRLPHLLYDDRGTGHVAGGDGLAQGTPRRPGLNTLSPNIFANSNGVGYGGLSAGVKVRRQQNGPIGCDGISGGRPAGVGSLNYR